MKSTQRQRVKLALQLVSFGASLGEALEKTVEQFQLMPSDINLLTTELAQLLPGRN